MSMTTPVHRFATWGRGTSRRHPVIATLTAVVLTGLAVANDAPITSSATPPAELVSVVTEAGDSFQPSISGDGGLAAFTINVQGNESVSPVGKVRDRAGSTTQAVPSILNNPRQDDLVISSDGCQLADIQQVPLTDPTQGPYIGDVIVVMNRCSATPPVRIFSATFNQATFALNDLAISAHGRYVAFEVFANSDVVLVDRDKDANGVLDDSPAFIATSPSNAFDPALGDETLTNKVAIASRGTRAAQAIYLWDPTLPWTDPAARILVSAIDGTTSPLPDQFAEDPTMTPDGRFVAFAIEDNGQSVDLPPLLAPQNEVMVRDVATNRTRIVSRNAAGGLANGESVQPSISADGTQVAFGTMATDLLAPDPGGGSGDGSTSLDLLVARSTSGFYDTLAFDRVSLKPNGDAIATKSGSEEMESPVISGNGRWVAFQSTFGTDLGIPSTAEQVYVIGRPTTIAVAPLDFGVIRPGTTSAVLTTTVANTGISSFLPAAIATTGPFAVVPGGTCATNVFLSPGQSCTLALDFSPTAPGPISGTVTLAEAGFAAVTATGSLAGSGFVEPPTTTTTTTTIAPTTTTTTTTTPPTTTSTTTTTTTKSTTPPTSTPTTTTRPTTTTTAPGTPQLTISPNPADFGTVPVGTAAPPLTFVVTNSGTAPASITGASVTGVHAADFALQSSTCTGISLPAAGTCTVIVGFTPSTFGPRFATLTVGSAATSATADLSGAGLDVPQLRLLPNVFPARGLTSADGTGFPPNAAVQLQWTGETAVFEATTDADGHFTMRVNAPADGRPGRHTLQAIDQPDAFSGVSADGLIAEASARPPTSRNPGLVGLPALVDR